MDAFIYGGQTYARLIAELAQAQGYKILGFIDDTSKDPKDHYESRKKDVQGKGASVFLGIGYKDLPARHKLLDRLLADGIQLPNLIHPSAHIGPGVELGQGNVLMAQSLVDSFSKMGNGNVLWPQASINHDSQVGHNNFFSPSSCICGFVEVEDSCFIGANATVVDHCKVPSRTFVKAAQLFKGSR